MKAKKFYYILHVTKPAKKNSKKPIANKVLRNQNWSNNKTMQLYLFFSFYLKDKKIVNSVTIKDNSYQIKIVLYLD